MAVVDRTRLAELLDRERTRFRAEHSGSRAVNRQANHLFGRVPMTWMSKWSGGFPLALDTAKGNRITDVDGLTYIDFALGDTGAMAGHSPAPTVRAVISRAATLGGITTMLPTEDAEWVGAELTRRFGLSQWSFTLSATDANRWAIRLARLVTGKPKLLVFSYCYHGSVDETFLVVGPDGSPVSRPGNVAPGVDPTQTTRVVEWNDLAAVEHELAHGDVAVILAEPALTNIGIVLPEPGFHDALRALATKYGALLMIDETHTISAGPGGMTARDALQPDIFVIGKSLGGGIPFGAYGLSEEVARNVHRHTATGVADIRDVGGVGGTLAGNALSLAAVRATLAEVLTDEAFANMIRLASQYTLDVKRILDEVDLPWSVTQLGARAEYRFVRPEPRNGGESAAAADDELDEYLHLFTLNRGILMTPFHNMALMCPDTTAADIDRHAEVFGDAVNDLVGR
ncbi:MAG: aminotransferase class III-fold pyridoxal phosphate-dependent enzyme [Acidimicrobiaceae bacterium]|nr:aminotransferase class III-fold pyridoxal phosphate-dependent enzyme [Acidimicrobiaceae bacterium]